MNRPAQRNAWKQRALFTALAALAQSSLGSFETALTSVTSVQADLVAEEARA